jgi:hypothetical protein
MPPPMTWSGAVALEQLRDAAGEFDDLEPALTSPCASGRVLPCSAVITGALPGGTFLAPCGRSMAECAPSNAEW